MPVTPSAPTAVGPGPGRWVARCREAGQACSKGEEDMASMIHHCSRATNRKTTMKGSKAKMDENPTPSHQPRRKQPTSCKRNLATEIQRCEEEILKEYANHVPVQGTLAAPCKIHLAPQNLSQGSAPTPSGAPWRCRKGGK